MVPMMYDGFTVPFMVPTMYDGFIVTVPTRHDAFTVLTTHDAFAVTVPTMHDAFTVPATSAGHDEIRERAGMPRKA